MHHVVLQKSDTVHAQLSRSATLLNSASHLSSSFCNFWCKEQLHYMNVTFLCDVTSCSLVEMYRRFRRTWNLRQSSWTPAAANHPINRPAKISLRPENYAERQSSACSRVQGVTSQVNVFFRISAVKFSDLNTLIMLANVSFLHAVVTV